MLYKTFLFLMGLDCNVLHFIKYPFHLISPIYILYYKVDLLTLSSDFKLLIKAFFHLLCS